MIAINFALITGEFDSINYTNSVDTKSRQTNLSLANFYHSNDSRFSTYSKATESFTLFNITVQTSSGQVFYEIHELFVQIKI